MLESSVLNSQLVVCGLGITLWKNQHPSAGRTAAWNSCSRSLREDQQQKTLQTRLRTTHSRVRESSPGKGIFVGLQSERCFAQFVATRRLVRLPYPTLP